MSKTVQIANKLIGDDYPCFITAEVGINHNGEEYKKECICMYN